jgi:hypothetical protein
LDTSPRPPTTGNSRAATTTLANRQHPTSLAMVIAVVGRSGMVTRLAVLRRNLPREVCWRYFPPHSRSGFSQLQLRGILAVASAHFMGTFMIGLHGRPKKGGMRLLRN